MSTECPDCGVLSNEELEEELKMAKRGREAWKSLALRQRAALHEIYTSPERAKAIADVAMRDTTKGVRRA